MKIPRDAEVFAYETPSGECREALVTYDSDQDDWGQWCQFMEVWQITAYNEQGEPYIVVQTDEEQQWAEDAYNPPKRPCSRERAAERHAIAQGVDL